MPQNFHTNLLHPADRGGCCHYRCTFPAWYIQTKRPDIRIIESTKFIPILDFYRDIRSVRIQRQISDDQCSYILNFLKPVSNRFGFWLIYEIDDVIGMDDIPKYNSGWEAYQNVKLMENVSKILSVCDFITVTTKTLGNYFVKKFGVDREKIIIVPNYIPRWWMDGYYDLNKISNRFENNKSKPRLLFASSTTHFDIFNRTGGFDDFTHINDFVRATKDKYDWVFVGGVPGQLIDLARDNKIKYIPGYDILNYPRALNELNPDIIIAPLQDNIFNNSKSNIKFIENAALGIPCICQNLITYRDYTDLLFNNANDLQNQIDTLLGNKEFYIDTVKKNRNIVDNGDKNSPKGWWLENNIDRWVDILTLPQRTLCFNLTKKVENNPIQNKVTNIDEVQFTRE